MAAAENRPRGRGMSLDDTSIRPSGSRHRFDRSRISIAAFNSFNNLPSNAKSKPAPEAASSRSSPSVTELTSASVATAPPSSSASASSIVPGSESKRILQWETDSRVNRIPRSLLHSVSSISSSAAAASGLPRPSLRKIKSAGRSSPSTMTAVEHALAATEIGLQAGSRTASAPLPEPSFSAALSPVRSHENRQGLEHGLQTQPYDELDRRPKKSASMDEKTAPQIPESSSAPSASPIALSPLANGRHGFRLHNLTITPPHLPPIRTNTIPSSDRNSIPAARKINCTPPADRLAMAADSPSHVEDREVPGSGSGLGVEPPARIRGESTGQRDSPWPWLLPLIVGTTTALWALDQTLRVTRLKGQLAGMAVQLTAVHQAIHSIQSHAGQAGSSAWAESAGGCQSSNSSKGWSAAMARSPAEGESAPEEAVLWWRHMALVVSLLALLLPAICLHFLDHIPKILPRSSVTVPAGDEEVVLSKKLAYKVDVLFSSHSWVKHAALLLATILLISIGGLALFAVSAESGLSLWDALWQAWTYVADAGNHADSEGLGPRVVSVTISFGGMLIFALMLGLVSDAISEKVDSLRKGRSEVIESQHTLVLGWSDKLGPIIKQLAVANESLGGGVVVVLAERDKEEMEAEIAGWEFELRGTRVICRSGSPLVVADLKKVSVSTARAIVVLAEVENADQSDARALRVVLSLTGVREGLRGHAVVELSDIDNEPLVKMVGGALVETVVAHDVIGRLMIQCARQPGLAQIWEDILGFENCEFYMRCWKQLAGLRFGDVLLSFPDAIPCGVRIAADENRILLNPLDSYVMQPDDGLLVVAEDDNSYEPAELPAVNRSFPPDVSLPVKMPEKILFCGWRRDIDDMIIVLEAFLAKGSELWMFSDVPIHERESRLKEGGMGDLENITLVHRVGNAVIRRHLESLPLENFDSILILADEALEDTVMNADSRSLATLLLIRDIQSKRLPYWRSGGGGRGRANRRGVSWVRQMQQASAQTIIISEILDARTRCLVSVSKISDYVLSNELVSMALAMVAEDREINRVLEELFAEEGNELYIRAAELYVYDREVLSFLEIMARARRREEIVIGYRVASAERAIINPPNKHQLRTWSLADTFVVIAREE